MRALEIERFVGNEKESGEANVWPEFRAPFNLIGSNAMLVMCVSTYQ